MSRHRPNPTANPTSGANHSPATTSLMTIAQLSSLLIEIHIKQVAKAKLSLEKTVQIRAEALKDESMDARISFIARIATTKNPVKGFQVQAISEKPDPRLSPGMTV